MGDLKSEIFVCLDCEMTGLDPEKDRIIEVAAVRFTFSSLQNQYESLVDPECEISKESLAIHNISASMLEGKPKIHEILPALLDCIGPYPIVGHGVGYDIELIVKAARRSSIRCELDKRPIIDTLRLARHYGDSPFNSLKSLAQHFNVPIDETHRAMADVMMNIEVFKHLVRRYQTTDQIFNILSHPIRMKTMPLGKHKGRPFSEIPLEYLEWSAKMNFDQDLTFTIRQEIKRRKKGEHFSHIANPFQEL